ncbi:MAG: DUF1697 domain-containing protein, partial [Acidimicrobiia bacterium]|nr:DUF1697 domain-containing protein [Acidimicrobiia bacterium]
DVGRLEKLIADRHGFTTEVFVRSETEMEALPQVNPFDGAEGKVELVFLGADPTDEVVSGIGTIATGPDTLRVIGREIWWLRPVPIDQSIPKETDLRRVLGADSTRRTFGTVEKIIAVMEAMRRA